MERNLRISKHPSNRCLMSRKLFMLIFGLCLSYSVSAQYLAEDLEIRENYHQVPFENFVEQLEANYGVQVFYFPGWVAGMVVKQAQAPSPLSAILNQTLEGSNYRYFSNADRQIVLTLGQTIQPQLRRQTALDTALEQTVEVSSRRINRGEGSATIFLVGCDNPRNGDRSGRDICGR